MDAIIRAKKINKTVFKFFRYFVFHYEKIIKTFGDQKKYGRQKADKKIDRLKIPAPQHLIQAAKLLKKRGIPKNIFLVRFNGKK